MEAVVIMDNFLDNGTVLPYGLVGSNVQAMMGGFNKSYRNTSLRLGIVVRVYVISDGGNLSKLTTEYDVQTFEQNEDRGSSVITYRNCIATESMGSIPDFLEKTLRIREGAPTIGSFINTKGQNGAVVLIQCLDGMSDKALIVGAVTHPDRQTTLVNDQPYLQGEYNGVNLEIGNDGSVTFTFKGATDNDGNIIDSSQGPSVAKIETDGSFQFSHSTITLRLDRNGTATLTTNKDLDLNVSGDANVMITGDATVQCNDLKITTEGDAELTVGGDCKADVSGKLVAKASEIDLNLGNGIPSFSPSCILTTTTDKVVDSIFGEPTQGVYSVKAGS
jgi:hypothetical protein